MCVRFKKKPLNVLNVFRIKVTRKRNVSCINLNEIETMLIKNDNSVVLSLLCDGNTFACTGISSFS